MRTGPMMDAAIRYLSVHGGVCPSAAQLTRAICPGVPGRWSRRVVERLAAQGLVRIDPRHQCRSLRGRGAIVLTATGEHYAWTLARAPEGCAA